MAVAPNRHAYGVESPLDDWRVAPKSEANCRVMRAGGQVGVRSEHMVLDLERALADEYRTDAHLVTYVMRDPRGSVLMFQPRVNKAGLSYVLSTGHTLAVECLFADVDNPLHCDWSPELRELAAAEDARIATAGVYYTEHGRRVVQPLERPVPVEQAEDVIHGWLLELGRLGLHPDMSCSDWTRHYRLPHVRASGRAKRSPHVDLSRMRPIEPPRAVRNLGKGATHRARIDIGKSGNVTTSPLGAALDHAGLLGRSLGSGKSTVLCPFQSGHTTGREFDSSTVVFGSSPTLPIGWLHCSHASCSGRSQADFIDELPPMARAIVDEARRATRRPLPERVTVPVDEARTMLEAGFRSAPDGLSVVIAGCGTGKSRAALVVARERASKPATPTGRAPLGSKTSISVPTNRLARELAGRATTQGASVRRIFGPLSVLDLLGNPVCAYHEAATGLAAGGLSVPWELCEGRKENPCDRAETCSARSGSEGPDDARITIGSHALLGALSGEAGTTGDLVIDEPPPLLTHVALEATDLLLAAERLSVYFEARYAAALEVSLRALAVWIGTGALDAPGPLARGVDIVDPDLLEIAFMATGSDTAVGAALGALDPKSKMATPPMRREYVFAARRNAAEAKKIGETARVAGLVRRALTAEPGTTIARIEERGREGQHRVLVITVPNEQLLNALKREGRCIVADAGGRLHLPIYEKIVGYAPRVVEAHAADGVPVERVHLKTRATRSGWLPKGVLDLDSGIVRALTAAVDWALSGEHPGRVAIITLQVVAVALRGALGADVAKDWKRLGQRQATLDAAVSALRPILARLPTPPDVGHYGAIRGLDAWKDHDCLVTFGDPWPHLTDARWESQFLELKGWEDRYEATTAAELEQAHGRLRVVHRKTPARALHVGLVRPGAWPADVETRTEDAAPVGRPKQPGSPDVAERVRGYVATLGGLAPVARRIGVGERSLHRYVSGERACPPDVLATLLRLAASECRESCIQ